MSSSFEKVHVNHVNPTTCNCPVKLIIRTLMNPLGLIDWEQVVRVTFAPLSDWNLVKA